LCTLYNVLCSVPLSAFQHSIFILMSGQESATVVCPASSPKKGVYPCKPTKLPQTLTKPKHEEDLASICKLAAGSAVSFSALVVQVMDTKMIAGEFFTGPMKIAHVCDPTSLLHVLCSFLLFADKRVTLIAFGVIAVGKLEQAKAGKVCTALCFPSSSQIYTFVEARTKSGFLAGTVDVQVLDGTSISPAQGLQLPCLTFAELRQAPGLCEVSCNVSKVLGTPTYDGCAICKKKWMPVCC
jgi:hypothetical protein